MKIILKEDVPQVGRIGEVVNVSNGFARNYLIPHKKAMAATSKNVRFLEHQKRIIAAKEEKRKKSVKELAQKLEGLSCTISKKAGENQKIFGSVTTMDIEQALRTEGFEIERKNILLEEPIKTLGVFSIPLKVDADLKINLKVWVVEEK